MCVIRMSMLALALLAANAAVAQQPADPGLRQEERNLRNAPDLKLSDEQKHTIYTSISNQNKKETAPPTFRAAIGSVVPETVRLEAMPKTIVQLMPQTKDYEYAMVANQVLVVDPKSKQIVELITQ
ncbi:MAG TPA: DUF1236 domain-containing protein [Pseudolabrys sp.]|nr:DUF1236 domain-containing protein [Pseudolabrys sp.]